MEKVDKLKLKNDWKQRGYSFGVFRDPPGQVLADFVHKTDELVVLAEGEIEIEIEDISGAHYSKDSGKLVWDLEIAGGATKKLKLVYSVKYPKEKKIGNL